MIPRWLWTLPVAWEDWRENRGRCASERTSTRHTYWWLLVSLLVVGATDEACDLCGGREMQYWYDKFQELNYLKLWMWGNWLKIMDWTLHGDLISWCWQLLKTTSQNTLYFSKNTKGCFTIRVHFQKLLSSPVLNVKAYFDFKVLLPKHWSGLGLPTAIKRRLESINFSNKYAHS